MSKLELSIQNGHLQNIKMICMITISKIYLLHVYFISRSGNLTHKNMFFQRLVLTGLIVSIIFQIAVCQRPPRLSRRNFRPPINPSSKPAKKLQCIDYGSFRDLSWICRSIEDCPNGIDP